MNSAVSLRSPASRSVRFRRYIARAWPFYLLILPAFLDVLIFKYFPMYGVQIGFRRYKAAFGIWGSEWVGLKYFQQFLEMPNFWGLIRNTLLLSMYCLVFGFPVPILLALMLNEQRSLRLKKATQMITYMPHFISTVAVVGIIEFMVDRQAGVINVLRGAVGLEGINFMGRSSAFRPMYVISDIWQHTGWSAIIYLAALAGVDTEALEAARIDGADRLQIIRYINIPAILPTIVVMLVLRCGSLLNVGFEKVYLMQNSLNLDVSEIIATYTYRMGILEGQFSYTTAIGLFNNVINAAILVLVNYVSRKISGSALW